MEKRRILLIALVTATFILGILFWGIPFYFEGRYFEGVMLAAIALLVALFAFKILYNLLRSVNKGYPLEDERTTDIKFKAGAYAFYIGIYWILILSWFEDVITRYVPSFDISSALGGAIFGQAVIFGIAYWALSVRGNSRG